MSTPLPERWVKLVARVNTRTSRNMDDPSVPLHKIGRYDIVILRGQGAYGIVFEAIDPEILRRVALKVCQVRDDQTVDDVLAEARLLAKLDDPHVITIHDTGRYGDDVFFVMEYATGGTVEDFADTDPPWQEILDVYLGAGAGLAAAHEKGIIHRDFKPSNVLVDEGGARPRVADFGFARIRLEHTREHEGEATQSPAGTLAYAAPEVLRGQAADALSDQWSFCVACWESLEGVLPFDAKTTAGMLATIDRLKPRWINKSVPASLRAVLERGLSMDPRERYPSMDELLEALRAERRAAPPPSDADKLEVVVRPPQRRRRKMPGWGYSVVGVLVGGLTVFLAMRAAREPVRDTTEPTTPTSECAVEPGESITSNPDLHEALLGVCRQIRDGQYMDASRAWDNQYRPGDAAVAEATSIVVRTFRETATETKQRDPDGSTLAADRAEHWAAVLNSKHDGTKAIEKGVDEKVGD